MHLDIFFSNAGSIFLLCLQCKVFVTIRNQLTKQRGYVAFSLEVYVVQEFIWTEKDPTEEGKRACSRIMHVNDFNQPPFIHLTIICDKVCSYDGVRFCGNVAHMTCYSYPTCFLKCFHCSGLLVELGDHCSNQIQLNLCSKEHNIAQMHWL